MPQQLCGTQLKSIAGLVSFDAALCLGGLEMLMEGSARWEKTLPKNRVTANLFFWSSELWSMCWHFLLVALDNLWMMCTGLFRTWHFLALPVYKAEPHVPARGIFSPTKPSPIPLSIINPGNTWISWQVGYRGIGRSSEVWSVEKPRGGNHLFWGCEWCAVLEELMDFLPLLGNDFVWKSSGKGGRICLCLKSF